MREMSISTNFMSRSAESRPGVDDEGDTGRCWSLWKLSTPALYTLSPCKALRKNIKQKQIYQTALPGYQFIILKQSYCLTCRRFLLTWRNSCTNFARQCSNRLYSSFFAIHFRKQKWKIKLLRAPTSPTCTESKKNGCFLAPMINVMYKN